MRIALLSTCAVAVPPKAYGGTELVVAELAKNLTRLGHHVVTYATGDSSPAGELWKLYDHPCWPPDPVSELRHCAHALRDIALRQPGFDLLHTNLAASLPLAEGRINLPTVLTIHHEREENLTKLYTDHPHVRYVAISRRQAELLPELDVRDVVHHGLDASMYEAGDGNGGYCAFLGRLAKEKGPHLAIDAARMAGVPLRVAGKAHPPDIAYFEAEVRPRLSGEGVKWVGELGHTDKVRMLRHARATLFPIQWEEPFGLVMIESMLVGTPVIAFPRGSAPEVIEHGITGFLVRSLEEMAQRLRDIDSFDRKACRRRAEERWSSMAMAKQYVRVYERAVDRTRFASHRWRSRPALVPDGSLATGTDDGE